MAVNYYGPVLGIALSGANIENQYLGNLRAFDGNYKSNCWALRIKQTQ
jgi:hypothetical protein